jgi:hypothetical protein
MNRKGCGRSGRGLIKWNIPALAFLDRGKPRKTSIRVQGPRTEIWTRNLPNIKQECQPRRSALAFHMFITYEIQFNERQHF